MGSALAVCCGGKPAGIRWPILLMAALTASAQPAPVTSADSRKLLEARVEEFYQLEVKKDFRHAEALVAEESKDYFYNSSKPRFESFHLTGIELLENGTRAKVTVEVRANVFFFGAAQVFDLPTRSNWKIENGAWVWYFDREAALNTPFSKMSPGPGARPDPGIPPGQLAVQSRVQPQVLVSRREVVLSSDQPVQFVTVSNGMPGPISLKVLVSNIEGVLVEVEKKELAAGDVAGLRFRLTGHASASGLVRIQCAPIGQQFDISVTAN